MNKLLLPLLATATAFAFAFACPMTSMAQDVKPATVLATTPDLHKGTEKKIEKFNEVSQKGEAEIVFLGDSITEGWKNAGKAAWEANFGSMKAANFGIGGDRTEHVLHRLANGNMDGLKPKLVVLMIGTNNTGHRMDKAEDTAAGVKAILDAVAKKAPEAKVLLLGVFPRGAKPDDKMRVRNTEINALIKSYADDKKVVFKDLADKFLTADGTLEKEIMPDLLHLSPKGYEIWASSILEQVKALSSGK